MARRKPPEGYGRAPPSGGPIPGYIGPVVGLQNEIVKPVEQQQLIVAGQNNPIRIVYGRQILGADVAGIEMRYGNLILLCVWCEGEIDAVERYWVNGADPSGLITATHYTGTSWQNPDPTLVAACSVRQGGGFAYTDSLPNIAYSVFEIPPQCNSGFPQITALIRGKKVASSSGGAKTYSDNPAYCIADFIESDRYGLGRSVDWDSVAAVAAYCDEAIGSPAEKRHQFSLTIDSPQAVEQWLTVMRDYASCWVVPEGGGYRLVLDATGAVGTTRVVTNITKANPMRVQTSVAHGFANGAIVKIAGLTEGMLEANGAVGVVQVYDSDEFDLLGVDASGFSAWTAGGSATEVGASAYSFGSSNIVRDSLSAQKRGTMDSPTIVEVDYTNASTYPWRTDTTDSVFIPGVYDSPPAVPFRRTRVTKTGLTRYSEAYRYAVQLLNTAQLDDLTVRFQAFDVAVQLQVGDLIDVSHPCGITSKIMRLTNAEPVAPGRWNLTATEHNDAKYSDVVVAGPGPIDSTLPSPLSPPAVSSLALVEIVTQTGTGDWISQVSVTWDDLSPPSGTYPFVDRYVVSISNASTMIETGVVQRGSSRYVSAALPENILYTVTVVTISTTGNESPAATATITNNGRAGSVPTDVPSISGYEIGGMVFLSWQPATDLDLTGYELRWGAAQASPTWEEATLLDRIAAPALRYETKSLPAGTQRIFIKALDSVRSATYPFGQESANATSCDVIVTLDNAAFVAATHDFTWANVSNMVQHRSGDGIDYWISDDGSTWGSTFANALSTYTDPLATYPGGFTSTLGTDTFDAGALVSGTWSATASYSDLSGSAAIVLQLADPTTFTDFPLATTATAENAKLNLSSSSAFIAFGSPHLTLAVAGRSESGTVLTSATTAATVNLASHYARAVSILLTPLATAAYIPTYDNVVVGYDSEGNERACKFDVYAFDRSTGNKAAVNCSYVFNGI